MKPTITKLLFCAALATSTTLCFANIDSTSSFPASNLYVGLEGGFDATSVNMNYSPNTVNYGPNGATYGVFAGYQSPSWKQLNLAVEVFYDGDQAKSTDTSWGSSYYPFTWNKTRDYGISLLPGYLITDNNKVFARFGYVNAKFVSNITSSDYVFNTPGMQLGLGYSFGFAKYFAARAEYVFSTFSNCDYPGTNYFSAFSNEFKVGLSYMLAL